MDRKNELSAWALVLLAAALVGGCAGGLAGYSAARLVGPTVAPTPHATGTAALPESKQPTSTLALITVGRPALTSVVPSALLKRRAASTASLYRIGKGTSFEDRLLGADRLLGQAVALTSDGWFVTALSALGTAKRADLAVWYDGSAYAVEKGVIDRVNGTVFLKTAAHDVTAASFSRVQDLVPGVEVWSEDRPGQLEPRIVKDLGFRLDPIAAYPSELAVRRVVLSGLAEASAQGSAVWDSGGQLLGVLDGPADQSPRLIPATSLSPSFSSLLQSGEIRHASLGVRAYDLGVAPLSGVRGDLPSRGALLADTKAGPAVAKDSPSAKAKLKTGDVILGLERDILDGTADLGEVLSEYRPGTQVTVRFERAGKDQEVSLTLGSFISSELLK